MKTNLSLFNLAAAIKIGVVDLEKYKITASKDFLEYSFYSKGPKGKVRKIVNFTPIKAWDYEYYNLGLGDWNENEKLIDDSIITNNQDTEKVLASVADIILDFSNRYPETFIGIKANTESRIRLYKMKINKYLKEIETDFELFGMADDAGLIPFNPAIKCLGFAGRRKIK
jgi:hypothetical protein